MNISALQEFYRGFDITAARGNNAFSYEIRSHQQIHVPPLIKGSIDDVIVGDEVVFCDFDFPPPRQRGEGQGGGLQERACKGLKNFVHIERPGQDIFIFDNHNHAFAFWAAALEQGVITKGTTLVHVDQHKDTRIPEEWFTGQGVFEACHYANHVLNVGSFIMPALKQGWFKDVIQVGSTEAFALEFSGPFVLDIDLDIFAPVMDYISEDLKVARLRSWISRASFITMATSPFFMDQNQALHYMRRLI